MNKYIIGGAVVVALVLGFFGGRVTAPTSATFGSYNPPVQSAGGFVASYATSTAYTLPCSVSNIQWLNTTALATGTINAATTTYAACPVLNNLGASVVYSKVVNDSTNTVAYVGGTGVIFKCETTAVGTSTVGAGGTCTASTFTILASSTVDLSYMFDGSSSSLVIDVGNNYK
jgi:hypothetical protein